MDLTFTIAEFGGALHQESIVLRDQLLREPLGLRFTDLELAHENDQVHLVGKIDNKVVAVTLLVDINKRVTKLRQFAVSEDLQGRGIGKKLLHFAENTARDQGKKVMELHAREKAVRFYARFNYEIVGELFEEVGVPHFKMRKSL